MNTGGVVNITGTLTNTSAILATPVTGVYTLLGGTVIGGTVSSGALTFGSTGGTLNGVTMNGNFSVPAGGTFYSQGNTTFTGGTTTFSPSSSYVYLNGSGTALTLASSAVWSGAMDIYGQATNLVLINQGSINETSGGDFFRGNGNGLAFTNSGVFTASSGTSITLGYYSNDSVTNSGTLEANGGTIAFDSYSNEVTNLASNTLTGGTWIAANGGTIEFQATGNAIVTNNATIVLDGSTSNIQTYSGAGPSYQKVDQTLVTNNGTLEVLSSRNFSASNAITNNGTIQLGGGTFTTSALTNGPGSTLSGFGTFTSTGGVTIGSSVLVSPGSASAGDYIGILNFGASTPVTFAQGGSSTFDIMNASGTAGTDFDKLAVAGALTVSATSGNPFTINVESISPGTGLPGTANFSLSSSYQWTLATAGSVSGFNASDFTINTSSFANGMGGGNFSVSSDSTDIYLNFTPVPEPSTWMLMAGGAALVGLVSIKRQPPKSPAVR
jgi:hypothetical protein